MSLGIDYHGYRYNADIAPSYIIASTKLFFHRPANTWLDRPALEARWTAESYTPHGGEVGRADHWLMEHMQMDVPAGSGGTGGGTAGTFTPTAANFTVTDVPASGASGDVANIDLGFGGKTVAVAKTLTLSVTLTGTGAGSHNVVVPLTAGMTASQAEGAIVTEWAKVAALNNNAPATRGTGTSVDVTPKAATTVTAINVSIA